MVPSLQIFSCKTSRAEQRTAGLSWDREQRLHKDLNLRFTYYIICPNLTSIISWILISVWFMEINMLLTQLLRATISNNLYTNCCRKEFKLDIKDLGLMKQKRLQEMIIMSHFYPRTCSIPQGHKRTSTSKVPNTPFPLAPLSTQELEGQTSQQGTHVMDHSIWKARPPTMTQGCHMQGYTIKVSSIGFCD